MKLITLNLWGGTVYDLLMEFIDGHSSDTDIFCFQEMLFGDKPQFTEVLKARENIFDEIAKRLPDFVPYKNISETKYFASEPITFKAGQAIFVRKSIKVKDSGNFVCYDKLPESTTDGGKLTGKLQWINIEFHLEELTIASLHGIWQKDSSKVDTPERFIQSEKINDFLKDKDRKILCGDFNLNPDGKSIEILEAGMKNLIKEYGIKSTRSSYYKKENLFADYILVSPNIQVNQFEVLQDVVSDHLPVFLNFN